MDKRIRLRDGRPLGYAEYGDPAGKPIFFFHGTPGSRLFRHPDNSIAMSLGVRIITIDRPGYGLSDFKPGRSLLDWPDDVVELAAALKIDRFAVAGQSGGGPHVAACAFKVSRRLTAAAILSGIGPFDAPRVTEGMMWMNRVGYGIARHAPRLWMLIAGVYFRQVSRNPEKVFDQITASHPDSDKSVLAQPGVRAVCIESYSEAFRAGTRGHAWEAVVLARPWGFRLEDIPMPIYLWHGEEDTEAPLVMAKYMASTIPHCNATFCPGEGHLLMFNHWKEILAQLAA